MAATPPEDISWSRVSDRWGLSQFASQPLTVSPVSFHPHVVLRKPCSSAVPCRECEGQRCRVGSLGWRGRRCAGHPPGRHGPLFAANLHNSSRGGDRTLSGRPACFISCGMLTCERHRSLAQPVCVRASLPLTRCYPLLPSHTHDIPFLCRLPPAVTHPHPQLDCRIVRVRARDAGWRRGAPHDPQPGPGGVRGAGGRSGAGQGSAARWVAVAPLGAAALGRGGKLAARRCGREVRRTSGRRVSRAPGGERWGSWGPSCTVP